MESWEGVDQDIMSDEEHYEDGFKIKRAEAW